MAKLIKPCPFCGGKVEIQIRDAEGNLRDEEYEKDPWSGLTYSIGHYTGDNPNCPIATYKKEIVGVYLYESKNEVIEAWNRRIKLIENEKGESISEEKYKEALEMIGDCELDSESDGNPKLIKDFYHDEYKTLENLIKEYFKLVKIHNKLLKLWGMEYPKAYEFKELKPDMWVYDTKPSIEEFSFFKIEKILSEKDCEYLYQDKNKKVFIDNITNHAREFEEGRYFPLTKAMEG